MNPLSLMLSLLSITTCFGIESSSFLTKRAWTSIDRVLFHPRVTPQLRERVHRVIYESYETWAFYQAREFTQHHYYKCRHIPMDEWKIYAARGLVQAIEAYEKGKAKALTEFGPETYYSFSTYARSAIRWSLFLGLTNLSPLSHVPKDKRIRKRVKNYTLYRPTIYDYEWVNNIASVEGEGEGEGISEAIQQRLDVALTQFGPFTRRVFETKYSPDGETRYSNKEVAKRMNCSEETIRKHLHKVIAKYKDSRLE
jgi:RNA polymerase sigma factor (sigma-70 family)